MGGEFAREFPMIAGRLGLEQFECADPYVERLLESFAFMAARVRRRWTCGVSCGSRSTCSRSSTPTYPRPLPR